MSEWLMEIMKIIFRPLFIECFVNSEPLITTRRLVNQSIQNHHLSFSHTSSRMYTIVLHSSNVLSIAHSNRFHKWNEWEKNVFFFWKKIVVQIVQLFIDAETSMIFFSWSEFSAGAFLFLKIMLDSSSG